MEDCRIGGWHQASGADRPRIMQQSPIIMTAARVTTLLSIVAVALLFFVDPATTAWFPWCPFRELTGLNCPGCGAARALHALVHLDVRAALRANLLVTIMAGPIAAVVAARSLGRGDEPIARFTTTRTLGWGVLALVAFGVVRNIPVWPLTWLNP